MSANPTAADVLPVHTLSDVVARIGAEVAGPLTAALDRVQAMSSSGRIDRLGLQALRAEIDEARRVGMRGQQIARLAGGLVQQTPERLNLANLLREVLSDQAALTTAVGAVGNRQVLAPAEVMADPSLLSTVLRAAADWSLEHACAPIEWRLEVQPWPVQAKLSCQVAHQPADLPAEVDNLVSNGGQHLASLDTLDWLLLRFSAHMAGVQLQRDDGPVRSTLTLRFPNTVNETLEGASAFDLAGGQRSAHLVAGSQVLVLAAKRDARQHVRDAMQGHELFIDYVPSVAAARDYCDEGAPHVLIFESAFTNESLRLLCQQLHRQAPAVALIEIMPAGRAIEQGTLGDAPVTRVGAEALRHQLAPLLVMAIAQQS